MHVHRDWLLTAERAAVHLPTATAVLADLHLGYNQVRQRGGDALPRTTCRTIVARLRRLTTRCAVRRLVIAGDLFEDGRACDSAQEFLTALAALRLELTGVVPGNHDRRLHGLRDLFPICPDGIRLGDWRVVHGDGRLPHGPVVQGHLHPCFRWAPGILAPCYLIGARRLVLPASSEDAAGVNVLGDRRWRRFRCGVIAAEEVLDFGVLGLLPRAGPGR